MPQRLSRTALRPSTARRLSSPPPSGISLASATLGTLAALLCAEVGLVSGSAGSGVGKGVTLPLQEYVTVYDSGGGYGRHRKIHVTEYYGRVSFGNPPQSFDMVFDTGSGNIVLPTVKCTSEACKKHHRFVSVDSSTAVQLAYDDGTLLQPGDRDRDTTTITYGTGKLTGEYIRDHFCLGNDGPQFCAKVDFLGVVQESPFPFMELPFDGIFGLGLGGLSAGPSFNFVNKLRSAGAQDPTFAVFLRLLDREEGSEITFGGWRSERLEDPERGLTWLPVPHQEADDKGYWLVTMRDIYVRGMPLGLCDDFTANPRCKLAMDTGSSMMMGPTFGVRQLLRAVGASCDELPVLRLELDAEAGGTFDMILRPEDYAEFSDGDCATAFQAIDLPPNLGAMWVIGQTALRKYYSVYDPVRWRVGVGLARHATEKRAPADAVDATAAAAAKATSPQEACVDNDVEMTSSQLPGCHFFSQLGYCRRFRPLAQMYCRLSCGFCTAPSAPPAAAQAQEPAPAQVAAAPRSQGSFLRPASNSGSEASGVTVRDSSIVVTRSRQKRLTAHRALAPGGGGGEEAGAALDWPSM